MPQPITRNIQNDDLSARFQGTSVVAGSPAAGSITAIATLTLAGFNDLAVMSGIRLHGWAAFTAGTNAVGATLAIRESTTTGNVVASTGAVTVVATDLYGLDVVGFDATPGVPVYVLCLTMASGSATSTVSAVHLAATVI
jgi:predicted permease